jgi:hypothetical protein
MTREVLSNSDIPFRIKGYLWIGRRAALVTLLAHLHEPSAALIATVEKAGKPTVRQVYALAAALCERMGEEFPESRAAASELIERLRTENGHPARRLDDTPLRS